MIENTDEARRSKLLVTGALYVIVDLLALVPVLVIALQIPDLMWFALGPYLFLTGAGLAAIMYLALPLGPVGVQRTAHEQHGTLLGDRRAAHGRVHRRISSL